MNYRKPMLPTLFLLTLVLCAASPAAATTLTSPTGTTYTSTFNVVSGGSTTLTSSFFVTIHCNIFSLSGKVETHGSKVAAGGKASAMSFSGCTDEVTVKKPGSLSFLSSGMVISSGAEILLHTTVGECIMSTSNTDIGDLTDSHETGGSSRATFDIQSKSIPVTGGSFFCPSSVIWEGGYVMTTPSTLYVD